MLGDNGASRREMCEFGRNIERRNPCMGCGICLLGVRPQVSFWLPVPMGPPRLLCRGSTGLLAVEQPKLGFLAPFFGSL